MEPPRKQSALASQYSKHSSKQTKEYISVMRSSYYVMYLLLILCWCLFVIWYKWSYSYSSIFDTASTAVDKEMEQLAQDLTVALEESESCGPIVLEPGRKWGGMRRRTRSAGNLHICVKSCDNRSEDSTSSNSEIRNWDKQAPGSVHHSDSDDMSVNFQIPQSSISQKSQSMKLKNSLHSFIRGRYKKLGMSHSLESDSFNEHSPARPSIRRKRKLKRMSVDETPVPPVGKRKRPQRVDIDTSKGYKDGAKIKPLHQSVLDKIEKFCQPLDVDCDRMETQCVNDSCELASESSLSWSGGEGHEGDDELTDWAPPQDAAVMDPPSWNEMEAREFRAGCRRVREERPGFSINTNANERVARFLQDTTRSELRLCGTERDKLHQLAALYSLELWFDGPTSSLLRKTNRTPSMQPTQRHHSGHSAGHKRIRTQDHVAIPNSEQTGGRAPTLSRAALVSRFLAMVLTYNN